MRNRKRMPRFFIFTSSLWLCFLTAPLSLYAQTHTDFRFVLQPLAVVFKQTNVMTQDYIVALDNYKKIDNRWAPEKFIRKQGSLLSVTVELPRDFDGSEVFAFYTDQLPENTEILFSCRSRSCGSSNNWANDHFAVKQLYGTDDTQHLMIARLGQGVEESSSHYVSIYTVRRGNRRLYTQLDVLSTKAIP